jgi:CO/xanthine dehydrogenase Mo-binding subunit
MEAPSFLGDIYPNHLLYAVTIRSPIANGFVKFIVYPKLPANYYIITARNIPGENRLEETSIPILAESRLSYIGEPVAILLGQDKTKLEELASQCQVIVDEEKAVFSCADAGSAADKPAAVREILVGDPDGAFSKSGKIVTGSFVTEIQDHWYAEPAGAVTWYEKDNEKNDSKTKTPEKVLVVKTATQWPYHVKRSIAAVLGIEQSAVLVEPTSLSLHMDGKLTFASLVACRAAIGTFVTKRPVRLILNREEDFLFSPKRCKANIDIASTIDEKGNITAAEIEIAVNTGAYGVNAQEILDQICLGTLGFYNFNNLKLTARAEKTNIPPQGPFSGFGLAQGFFAMERHISHIADGLNQDPAEWRKKNADSRLILPSGTSTKSNISIEELIGEAASMSDYYRKWASYDLLRQSRKGKPMLAEKEEDPRGIGMALGFQGNGLLYSGEDKGNYTVEVTLTKELILEIKTSITSSDEDYGRIWARVASEIMSIEPDMVRVNTVHAPDCGPSCASRNITTITKLVEKCCHAIRKQRFHDPLPITVRRSIKPQSGSLFNGLFTPPEGKIMDVKSFSKPGMAAAVVEVTIDLIQCIPKVRGVWLGIYGGRIISKNRARRSLIRDTVQALGWTFTENIAYSNGIIPLEQYNNYIIPIPANTPPININFLSGDNVEPRGIGELPFTCIPAAFLQAVSQAMDHCYKSIPLKRKEIWDMVRLRNAEMPAQGTK